MKPEYHFYVYMMASKSRVLYTGMCNDIVRRVAEHKRGAIEGFTKRYNVTRLVYYERWHYVNNCIRREKQVKAWDRAKRVALIEAMNPTWEDLAGDWYDENFLPKPNSRSLAALGMTNKREAAAKKDRTHAVRVGASATKPGGEP